MLAGKSVLVTGGTGSFGKAFVRTVLERFPQILPPTARWMRAPFLEIAPSLGGCPLSL